MAKYYYELDDKTKLYLSSNIFGKIKIEVNGKSLKELVKVKNKVPFLLNLEDGREVSITSNQVGFVPEVEVRVDKKLMLPTNKHTFKECSSCKSKNKPNNNFCNACGASLPAAEIIVSQQKIAGARSAIMILACMFTLFGIVLFFAQKNNVEKSMTNLEKFQDTDFYPETIGGQQMTVGALKQQLAYEPWSILIINFILATIMIGLWFWARKSPVPAIIIASAVYGVVLVGNGIYDPNTIAQGLIMKIVIISILANGIKSALAAQHAKSTH